MAMNTKWEEDFKEISSLWAFDQIEWLNAKKFVETEIIEPLIDDAANYSIVIDKDKFKQYLRDKWL